MLFFNDTATTESYTDLHTLSLHDAHPIYSTTQQSLTADQSLVENIFFATRKNFRVLSKKPESGFFYMFVARSLLKKGLAARSYIFFSKYSFLNRLFFFRKISSFTNKLRSEEHTSELQSLMRISFAVFCFKKKK